ncbi:MAG TPA: dienelactone hydrolase family protein [Solirubrobacteraceae bacterium]|nr:dienelactone hydrolase family protein [Solirubrobacteraceae bacterium]
MKREPRLLCVSTAREPRGAVLVLHGGASRRTDMGVSPTQLSVIRMVPIARRVARAGAGTLQVFRLLNSYRGWESGHTPVKDVRWALARIPEQLGRSVPVCLIGHSLGGRAALLTAGEPSVAAAVALAPWVLPGDVPRGLHGTPLLIVHGAQDRIASPDRPAALAARLQGRAEVEFVLVPGAGHAMLRHHDAFSRRAARFATRTLLGGPAAEDPPGAPTRAARASRPSSSRVS